MNHNIDEAQLALTQDRHASYFCAVICPQPDFRNFPATQREMDALATEAANFRTAVRRATTTSTGLLADLVVPLHGPWHRFGWPDELRGWLEQTLRRKDLAADRRVDCLMSLVRSGTQSGPDTAPLDDLYAMPAPTADLMRRQVLVDSIVSNRVWSDRFGEAQELLAGNRDEAAALGDPALLCERMNVQALGELFRGREEAAAETLRSAWTLANENDLDRLAMVSGHNLSELLLGTDAAAEAADVTAQLITAGGGGPGLRRTAALSNFGAAKLLLGEHAESLAAVRSALSTMLNTGWLNEGLDVLLRLAAALADTEPGDARSVFLFGVWSPSARSLA